MNGIKSHALVLLQAKYLLSSARSFGVSRESSNELSLITRLLRCGPTAMTRCTSWMHSTWDYRSPGLNVAMRTVAANSMIRSCHQTRKQSAVYNKSQGNRCGYDSTLCQHQLRRAFSTSALLRVPRPPRQRPPKPVSRPLEHLPTSQPSSPAESNPVYTFVWSLGGYSRTLTVSPHGIAKVVQRGFIATFILVSLALHMSLNERRSGPNSTVQRNPAPQTPKPSIPFITPSTVTYRRGEWPPHSLAQCMPYIGYNFAHSTVNHLLFNSIGFYFITNFLFPTFGVLTTSAAFLGGGVLASQIDSFAAQAYATGQYSSLFSYIKDQPRDPRPDKNLSANCLGASSGLCALLMVTTIARPFSKWSIMMIPVQIPLVYLTTGEVLWEAYSFYSNVDDGIGHGGHLAGHLAGVVLWLGVLRWTKYGKFCRAVRFSERHSL